MRKAMYRSARALSSARASLPLGGYASLNTAVALVLVATTIGGTALAAQIDNGAIQAAAILEVGPARAVARNTLRRMTQEDSIRAPLDTPEAPFRPTMSREDYESAKAASAAMGAQIRGSAPSDVSQGDTPNLQAGPSVKNLIIGVDKATAGGWRPPDTHGAAGRYHYCQVVNSYLQCYQKGTKAVVVSASLNGFFGYAGPALFDPRIVYDAVWDRFVLYAEAFPESPTVQKLFIAVSKAPNPAGSWWTYSFNITQTTNDFWDYGGLGMDQDAVIITANNFNGQSFVDARLFSVAKARLYNGRDFSVPLFTGLAGTLQPPIVLDQDAQAYVVAAEDNTTGEIRKYTLEKTANAAETTITSSTIAVSPWSMPPDAQQQGTLKMLDTLDGRFQNASTQNAGMLWQTHTTGARSVATPRWYRFNAETNAVLDAADYFVYPGSHDFNPSIAANASGDVFVTWAMTCPTAGPGCPEGRKNLWLRFSGKRAGDASLIGNNPTGTYGYSQVAYTEVRFGDYSSVSIDPVDPTSAWVTNEFFTGATTWGSRIARIGY